MATFRQTDITRNSGDVFEAARRGPVTITHHKRPTFVIMSFERFEQISKADSRVHHRIEDVPVALIDEAEAALDLYEAEGEA